MKKSELKSLIKECIVEMSGKNHILATNKKTGQTYQITKSWYDSHKNLYDVPSKTQSKKSLDGKSAFKSLKTIIDDNQLEDDWPWKKYGKEVETALTKLGKDTNITEKDVEDIYFHFIQGEKLKNDDIKKSPSYNLVKKAMYNLNKIQD